MFLFNFGGVYLSAFGLKTDLDNGSLLVVSVFIPDFVGVYLSAFGLKTDLDNGFILTFFVCGNITECDGCGIGFGFCQT